MACGGMRDLYKLVIMDSIVLLYGLIAIALELASLGTALTSSCNV